jgi:hypothetical protein
MDNEDLTISFNDIPTLVVKISGLNLVDEADGSGTLQFNYEVLSGTPPGDLETRIKNTIFEAINQAVSRHEN